MFESWLIATYGESLRRPGRPAYSGLRETRRLLVAELRARSASYGVRLDPPKQPIALYHWLATAKGGTRTTPRKHVRNAIAAVTGGEVPAEAWDAPAQQEAA